jgi:hypothetical protein
MSVEDLFTYFYLFIWWSTLFLVCLFAFLLVWFTLFERERIGRDRDGEDRDRLREGDSYDERNCIILICERRKEGVGG